MSRSKNLLIFFVKYLVISKKSSTFAPGFERDHYMVAIAQLAEHRIVVPSVVGSSPTSHPKKTTCGRLFLWLVAWREPIKRGVPENNRASQRRCTFFWGERTVAATLTT